MQHENFLQIVFRFQFQVIKILQFETLLNSSVYLLLNITGVSENDNLTNYNS
jgi:hypothetical protein